MDKREFKWHEEELWGKQEEEEEDGKGRGLLIWIGEKKRIKSM